MKKTDRRQLHELLRHLSMLTQFGLSLVAPVLICVGFCAFLTARTGIGPWIYIPGFLFGLGGSVSTALKFGKMVSGQQKREDKDRKIKKRKGISFNEHV